MRLNYDPSHAGEKKSKWWYKDQPCEVVGLDFDEEKKEVCALFINTGVGPDIRAEFDDMLYEVLEN